MIWPNISLLHLQWVINEYRNVSNETCTEICPLTDIAISQNVTYLYIKPCIAEINYEKTDKKNAEERRRKRKVYKWRRQQQPNLKKAEGFEILITFFSDYQKVSKKNWSCFLANAISLLLWYEQGNKRSCFVTIKIREHLLTCMSHPIDTCTVTGGTCQQLGRCTLVSYHLLTLWKMHSKLESTCCHWSPLHPSSVYSVADIF